jgi:DNA-binding NtrC family response regulator
VVDDEFIIRQSSMAILQDAGFEVLEARNGKEAVEVYKNGHSSIDIVLLDLVMPHLGGHHTFYALREINPAAKIIVGSGYNLGAGNAQELLDSGALAFIQKPYRSASLIRTLNEHLKG